MFLCVWFYKSLELSLHLARPSDSVFPFLKLCFNILYSIDCISANFFIGSSKQALSVRCLNNFSGFFSVMKYFRVKEKAAHIMIPGGFIFTQTTVTTEPQMSY